MDDRRLPSMRAADSDRERVLEVVRQALAEGRLTTEEFYERLEAVYQAKTYGELDRLVTDLPIGAVPTPVVRKPGPTVVRPGPVGLLAQMPHPLRNLWITWATVVSINVLIWLIVAVASLDSVDGAPPFWPIWVAGPWGVVNLGITLTWRLNRDADPGPPALPPGSG